MSFFISNNEKVSLKIGNIEIENTLSEILLDIITDSKRNIKEHLKRINEKASRKINVLSRTTPYMNLPSLITSL